MLFEEKCFSHYILLTNPIPVFDHLDLLRYWVDMFVLIICCPVCDVINFEINYSFVTKSFFYITKKSRQKCEYVKNEKSF